MSETVPTYFRCRTADKREALQRLDREARLVFADLQPTFLAVRRIPSREQHRRSQQTEIVLRLRGGRSARIALPKPVGAIDRQDLCRALNRIDHP